MPLSFHAQRELPSTACTLVALTHVVCALRQARPVFKSILGTDSKLTKDAHEAPLSFDVSGALRKEGAEAGESPEIATAMLQQRIKALQVCVMQPCGGHGRRLSAGCAHPLPSRQRQHQPFCALQSSWQAPVTPGCSACWRSQRRAPCSRW